MRKQGCTGRLTLIVVLLLIAAVQIVSAATFTVKNNCSYTIYPGIYPASYSNGGWTMASGSSVSFTLANGWDGRIWGRIGCNGASPAVCSTGSCGGTGLQCAGTTGQAGTSLAEFNLDASGTDWYDVSYVDGMDNPIGVTISNSSCVSPSACTMTPITSCNSALKSGSYCLSPCTMFNTDQYCCRNAYGTNATCVVANWPAAEQSYVNNIHTYCPNEYSYAYDDSVGLHTCATGSNYTITFCPSGSGTTNLNGAHQVIPQNITSDRMDDYAASTANGNKVDIYPANGTAAQSWVFNNSGVTPSGNYNIAVSLGAYCLDVAGAGTANGTLVQLYACNGTNAQSWNAVPTNGYYELQPANAPGSCLDVTNNSTTAGTQLQIWTCAGTANQLWAIN